MDYLIEFHCQVKGSKEEFKVQMYPLPFPGSTIRLKGGRIFGIMSYMHDCEKNKVIATVIEVKPESSIQVPSKIIKA